MILSFYGMRRSGIHAVLEWFVHSLGGGGPRRELIKNRVINYGGALYINECNTWEASKVFNIIESYKDKDYYVVLCYEDTELDFCFYSTKNKIVLIRDIINLAASRTRAWRKDLNEEVLNKWLKHTLAKNVHHIKYESWLIDKKYRDNFISYYKKTNLDKTNYVTRIGGGSSFVGVKLDKIDRLLNRHRQIGYSENVKKLLNRSDVVSARKSMGYENQIL